MDARALVARNLRRIRIAAGISQEALAVDASIDRTYVSRLERGLENPTVVVLERLAKALGTAIVEFFAPVSGRQPLGGLKPGRKPSRTPGHRTRG